MTQNSTHFTAWLKLQKLPVAIRIKIKAHLNGLLRAFRTWLSALHPNTLHPPISWSSNTCYWVFPVFPMVQANSGFLPYFMLPPSLPASIPPPLCHLHNFYSSFSIQVSLWGWIPRTAFPTSHCLSSALWASLSSLPHLRGTILSSPFILLNHKILERRSKWLNHPYTPDNSLAPVHSRNGINICEMNQEDEKASDPWEHTHQNFMILKFYSWAITSVSQTLKPLYTWILKHPRCNED